jgi:hypothetical protein
MKEGLVWSSILRALTKTPIFQGGGKLGMLSCSLFKRDIVQDGLDGLSNRPGAGRRSHPVAMDTPSHPDHAVRSEIPDDGREVPCMNAP